MLRCEINAFMNYAANFPNIYSIYLISTLLDRVDIRKIDIVHKGVYFKTKHVKRVHIRCKCTFY